MICSRSLRPSSLPVRSKLLDQDVAVLPDREREAFGRSHGSRILLLIVTVGGSFTSSPGGQSSPQRRLQPDHIDVGGLEEP